MNIIQRLLLDNPLYKAIEVPNKFGNVWAWHGQHIKMFCHFDKEFHTFYLRMSKELTDSFGGLPQEQLVLPMEHKVNGNLNFVIFLEAKCPYCGNVNTYFLIRIFQKGSQMYAEKIGSFPPMEISPDKSILPYLTTTQREFYKKALMNQSHGYGIGALAYFRRITEDIIKQIIYDLSQMETPEGEKIRSAQAQFSDKHSMSNLLDAITPHLPSSLLEIGDNPLRLLYGAASMGIHNLDDAECSEKAAIINELFIFTISKLNEQKEALPKLRQSIKKLKG